MTARRVVLARVPAAAYIQIQRHIDEIFRELQVIEVGQQASGNVPPELRSIMARVLNDFADARAAAWAQADQAMTQGSERVDVIFELEPDAVPALGEFNTLLDEVDRLCHEGRLLALPEPEGQMRLRAWCMRQIELQVVKGTEPEICPL